MVIRADILNGVVIIKDLNNSRKIYFLGYFGKPINAEKVKVETDITSPLILNSFEALYLMEKGVIDLFYNDKRVNDINEAKKILKINSKKERQYEIYKELRDNGLKVRSGLKYGSDFVAYRLGPGIEHAPFIIHYYDINENFDPIELVRAGRLSHSVKKDFIISSLKDNGKSLYIIFKWFKP
ncbi:tRNA intron endonuclease [Caldisphaera lagunensis DSM 15908]|uniref:tRNA intron endonuclease n=1 Tax=Caldisphaera lagunensis (strain DSM 15908 / JCM 11604 / ANMR 0165 / IC-154) TaxID=1056495 RepID=L0AA75_CALLD|nr:tRNA-intron lyase [Caldisphaera lagunensis]AFZ70766.1 tRNA intron endonuclease [Caldisphaera lagunensis DSM 15908]